MEAFVYLLLAAVTTRITEALLCRECVSASHLEDCTSSIKCNATEICYTDSVIHDFVVKFNAGCSARSICSLTGSAIGRRQTHLLPCSKCCDDSDNCNTNLCGITSNQTLVLSTVIPDTTVTARTTLAASTSPPSFVISSQSSLNTTTVSPTDGLKCRKCINASHLEECTEDVQCQVDEHCYMESIIHNFVVKFNAGCSHRAICSFTGPIVGKRQHHLLPCSKCCEGSDLCNANLCGITSNKTVVLATVLPVTTVTESTSLTSLLASSTTLSAVTTQQTSLNTTTDGLKCIKCVNASHLEECTTTVQCRADEHCYTESIIHNLVVKFNAGCSLKTICGFTGSGKRQTHLLPCSKCCEEGDLCNANLCGITSNQTVVLPSNVPPTTVSVTTSTLHTSPRITALSTEASSTTTRATSVSFSSSDMTPPTTITAVSTTSGLLKCRKCVAATVIEHCTSFVECSPDEQCYLEARFVNFHVQFNGGCSSRTICGLSGRRRQTGLVACFKCCSGSDFCNAKLCGIKSDPSVIITTPTPTPMTSHPTAVTSSGTTVHTTTTTSGTQCYFCNELHHGRVSGYGQCGYMVTCQTDEMCSVEDFTSDSGALSHTFGCQHKNICRLLTKLAIEDRYRCEDPHIQGAGFCNRKRETEKSTCNVCCGDRFCNGESCTRVLDGLYVLWKLHILDMYTLKQNGSFPPLPGTTTIQGS